MKSTSEVGNFASGGKDEARRPHPTTLLGTQLEIRLWRVFFNKDALVGFDILACADGAAGPEDFDCLNNGIAAYAEDSGEFTL